MEGFGKIVAVQHPLPAKTDCPRLALGGAHREGRSAAPSPGEFRSRVEPRYFWSGPVVLNSSTSGCLGQDQPPQGSAEAGYGFLLPATVRRLGISLVLFVAGVVCARVGLGGDIHTGLDAVVFSLAVLGGFSALWSP
jgi:hypothetical protein